MTRMRLMGAILGMLAFAAAGCGHDGGAGGVKSRSCVFGMGVDRQCLELVSTVPISPNCPAGDPVDSCDHAGSDGACRYLMGPDTLTIWYYTGTAEGTAYEMSVCTNNASNGAVWIPPS